MKNDYKEVKEDTYSGTPFENRVFSTIANSTPLNEILDKIRAEIERTANEKQKYDEKWAISLRYAVKIIDKYISEYI